MDISKSLTVKMKGEWDMQGHHYTSNIQTSGVDRAVESRDANISGRKKTSQGCTMHITGYILERFEMILGVFCSKHSPLG